ncbi:MAG: anti-sigma factor [Solirubrobacterales bacterium]
MNETGHERWNDEVAAYMLGALEPHEVEKLEHHLERCELCRDQMRWLRPAVGALPGGVKRLEPPPGLRDRILGEAEIAPHSSAPLRDFRVRMRSWGRGFGSRGRGWRPAVAAALALLALFAIVVTSYLVGARSGDFEPATQVYRSAAASGVSAVVTREGSRGILELENVEDLDRGMVLEAWVLRDETTEPVPALFVPNEKGEAWTTIEGMRGVDAVRVTEEPAGGSVAPTAAPIAEVTIAASS